MIHGNRGEPSCDGLILFDLTPVEAGLKLVLAGFHGVVVEHGIQEDSYLWNVLQW